MKQTEGSYQREKYKKGPPKWFIPRSVKLGLVQYLPSWGTLVLAALTYTNTVKTPTVIIPPTPVIQDVVPIETHDLSKFIAPKGGISIKDDTLSLNSGTKRAYFLSEQYASEHSIVDLWFTPLTQQLNYYLIVENSFIIIFGDGDRRAITLKAFSSPEWAMIAPKGKNADSPRFYLPKEMPIGHEVHARADISARISDMGNKVVQLEINFYDNDGNIIITSPSKPMIWEFTTTTKLNRPSRFGIGLMDPTGRQRPMVGFGGIKVTEKK